MLSSDVTRFAPLAASVAAALILASCTLEPLNATRSYGSAANDGTSQSIRDIMRTITVDPVKDRVAQQVRNNLLFELNGGQLQPGGRYNLKLDVATGSRSLAIESDSLSPTSAQVAITVNYELIDISSGKEVAGGKRRAVASFDKTPQKFANERAERDAENRAAKDAARQIRFAIGQSLAKG